MMGVDGLVGNWLGGVAAKAGSDEIRMNNLGGGAIGASDLLWMGGEAVFSTGVVVDGLGCEGRVGVAVDVFVRDGLGRDGSLALVGNEGARAIACEAGPHDDAAVPARGWRTGGGYRRAGEGSGASGVWEGDVGGHVAYGRRRERLLLLL